MVVDRHVEVVVVGSGAAGMMAAISASDGGCSVLVLEKSRLIGGATGVSGGGVWVPSNPHMRELGVTDSRAEALTYLTGLTHGREIDAGLMAVYVDEMRGVLEYLESATPVRFRACNGFSDYYADRPGGKPMGRTLHPLPYEARAMLGEWDALLRESPHFSRITVDEWAATVGGQSLDLEALSAERSRTGTRTLGGALAAGLLRAVLDRGIAVALGTRAEGLLVENGSVVGVVAQRHGERETIRADRGVVLAAGGFDWDPELMHAFVGVRGICPTSPPSNEGDALVIALGVGAAVANLSATWAYPVVWDGRSTYDGRPLYLLRSPYREPGTIIVNRRGRRFANEGVSYMDFPKALRAYDAVTHEYPNEPPVWEIFDQTVRERLVVGDLRPGRITPEWVIEAPTIDELADAIGVDGDGLRVEIARFNSHVARGSDSDFGRGTVWFEGYLTGGPPGAAALAPIDSPPYYAMPVYEGATGTAGGVRVDDRGRVLAMRDGVIDGLYAAGNTAASIFGPVYPAGGAILGQALLFGYLAGRDIAGSAHCSSR
jgi:succinate dehydrogenase/fumarate reductase flavoprotein subunit